MGNGPVDVCSFIKDNGRRFWDGGEGNKQREAKDDDAKSQMVSVTLTAEITLPLNVYNKLRKLAKAQDESPQETVAWIVEDFFA